MADRDVLVLRLALPPNIANPKMARDGGVHWRAGWAVKKRYVRGAVAAIQRQARGRRFTRAVATYELIVPGRRDPDNSVWLTKFIADALRDAGVVRNDRPPHYELAGLPDQTIVSPARRRKGEPESDYQRRKHRIAEEWGVRVTLWERP